MEKSERKKMLAGEVYIALDRELGEMNLRARQPVYFFNSSPPAESAIY